MKTAPASDTGSSSSVTEERVAASKLARQIKSFKRLGEFGALVGTWLALLLVFGALSNSFLTLQTLGALANRIPALAVVSVGMTLVLIIGGIDLSVGSLLGLAGAVLGVAMVDWHWSLWAGCALCLTLAGALGLVNGFLSVRLGIPSFIVTLGMLEVARGLAYLVTHSETKYIGPGVEGLSRPLAGLGLSPAFFLAVLVVATGQIALSRTLFGRYLVAIGSNERAFRLAGVNPAPAKIAVFALVGLLTGLGALFYTSRLGSSDPNAGVGMELSAIAAVVIGGTSLMGGRGSVVSSFLGVLIIATLDSGLAQVGATEPTKRVVTGMVIILAVVLDAGRRRLAGQGFPLWQRLLGKRTPLAG